MIKNMSKAELAVLKARYEERRIGFLAIEEYITRAIHNFIGMPFIPGDELGKDLHTKLNEARLIVNGHINETKEAQEKLK